MGAVRVETLPRVTGEIGALQTTSLLHFGIVMKVAKGAAE